MDNQPNEMRITVEQFRRRIINMLGRRPLTGIPRKETDKLCLLLAAAGALKPEQAYSEQDVNAQIQRWLMKYDQNDATDHVMLRRLLVDYKFLERSHDGQTYHLLPDGPGFLEFEPEVLALDVDDLIETERSEAEARRAQFTQDS